jgi:hypothetical protein
MCEKRQLEFSEALDGVLRRALIVFKETIAAFA